MLKNNNNYNNKDYESENKATTKEKNAFIDIQNNHVKHKIKNKIYAIQPVQVRAI